MISLNHNSRPKDYCSFQHSQMKKRYIKIAGTQKVYPLFQQKVLYSSRFIALTMAQKVTIYMGHFIWMRSFTHSECCVYHNMLSRATQIAVCALFQHKKWNFFDCFFHRPKVKISHGYIINSNIKHQYLLLQKKYIVPEVNCIQKKTMHIQTNPNPLPTNSNQICHSGVCVCLCL